MAEEVLTQRSLAGLTITKVAERSSWYNILIYGDSGSGKTRLAGSADAVAGMRPVLVIDIEGGTETLKHTYPDVDVVRVTTWKKMQEVYNELADGNSGYNTVILDSLTEIQKFSMYNIMEELTAKSPERSADVPSMREWGINLEQTRRLVRGFRDLDMHTVIVSLARHEKNEKTGVTSTQPSLSGKMAGEVAAFLDVVVFLYVKQIGAGDEQRNVRFLLSQKTETHIAKDRTNKLPQVLEEPTMQKIHDYMRGKIQPKEIANGTEG